MSKIQLNSLFRSIWGRSLPHRVVKMKCVNILKPSEVLYKIGTMVGFPVLVLASTRNSFLEKMMYIIKIFMSYVVFLCLKLIYMKTLNVFSKIT